MKKYSVYFIFIGSKRHSFTFNYSTAIMKVKELKSYGIKNVYFVEQEETR